MFEVRPDAYTDDPETCDRRGPTVDSNAWCELCGVWVNCISAGCITRPDGKVTAHDNSPGSVRPQAGGAQGRGQSKYTNKHTNKRRIDWWREWKTIATFWTRSR